MSPPDKHYSRQELAVVLAANAAAKPFNVLLGAAAIGAASAIGAQLQLALIVGLVVYAIATARTFLDEDEAAVVHERLRGEPRQVLEPPALAPDVRRHLLAARALEASIRAAIESAELPHAEVSYEVEALVALLDESASRAQLLYEALAESPAARIEQRLAELRGTDKARLVDALEQQLSMQRTVEGQLQRFYDEMERIVVELDTIRASIASVSASTDAAGRGRIAADVRALRDELGALATSMGDTFEEAASAADTPPA
jgi:uncharacterized protein (UPF0335 family)